MVVVPARAVMYLVVTLILWLLLLVVAVVVGTPELN